MEAEVLKWNFSTFSFRRKRADRVSFFCKVHMALGMYIHLMDPSGSWILTDY